MEKQVLNPEDKPLKKAELIAQIAELSETSKKVAEEVIANYERLLLVELSRHHEVKVGLLGKIKLVERKEKVGINPKTKEKAIYPARLVPKFSFSSGVKEFVTYDIGKK